MTLKRDPDNLWPKVVKSGVPVNPLDHIEITDTDPSDTSVLIWFNTTDEELKVRVGSTIYKADMVDQSITTTTTTTTSTTTTTTTGSTTTTTTTDLILMIQANGDLSGYERDLTFHGTGMPINSQIKKFSASYEFNGSSYYLSIPDDAVWDFGTNDFTIELWFRTTGSNAGTLISHWDIDYDGLLITRNTSGNILVKIGDGGGAWDIELTSSGTHNDNVWHHCALVRDGNDWDLYIDGSSEDSTTLSHTISEIAEPLLIGYNGGGAGNFFSGYIECVRVSDNARWATGFSTPTAEPESDANTLLLLNPTGDQSWIGHSILMRDGQVIDSGDSENYTFEGSFKFDGSADYLTLQSSESLDFGGDFTIEFWFKRNGNPSGWEDVFKIYPFDGVTPYLGLFIGLTSDGYINALAGDGIAASWDVDLETTSSICDNDWHHIAYIRDGNDWDLYIDGVSADSATASISLGDATQDIEIGGSTFFGGSLDAIRVKAEAVWSAAFQVPNRPWPKGYTSTTTTSTSTTSTSTTSTTSTSTTSTTSTSTTSTSTTSTTSTTGSTTTTTTGSTTTTTTGSTTTTTTGSTTTTTTGVTTTTIDYTVMHLPSNGDMSLSEHNLTFNGGMVIDASDGPLDKTGSFKLDGSMAIQIPDSTDFFFASEDFTIELWAKFDSNGTNERVITQWESGTSANSAWQLMRDSDNTLYFRADSAAGTSEIVLSTTWTTTAATWYHIAIVRDGGNAYLYVDGVQRATDTVSSAIYNVATDILIGALWATGAASLSNEVDGNIAHISIEKGVAKYPGGTTFTKPTEAPEVSLFTVLNISGLGDLKEAHDLTFIDGMVLDSGEGENELFFGSHQFDGSTDYIQIPDSNDFHFSDGNFCIELWVRFGTNGTDERPISQWETGTNSNQAWMLMRDTNNTLYFTLEDGSGTKIIAMTTTWTTSVDTWYHIAMVRNGSNAYLYVDGVQRASESSVSGTAANSARDVLLGGIWANGGGSVTVTFDGFIDDVKVTKGDPVYTAAFTKPTTPHGLLEADFDRGSANGNWATEKNAVNQDPFRGNYASANAAQDSWTTSKYTALRLTERMKTGGQIYKVEVGCAISAEYPDSVKWRIQPKFAGSAGETYETADDSVPLTPTADVDCDYHWFNITGEKTTWSWNDIDSLTIDNDAYNTNASTCACRLHDIKIRIWYVGADAEDRPTTTANYYFDTLASDGGNGGDVAWTNIDNAEASDDSYATCSLAKGDYSYFITSSSNTYSSGGSGDIKSVELFVEGKANGADVIYIIDFKPIYNGTDGEEDFYVSDFSTPRFQLTDSSIYFDVTHDYALEHPDIWTWTDIANLDMSVGMYISGGDTYTVSVDSVGIRVTYTTD